MDGYEDRSICHMTVMYFLADVNGPVEYFSFDSETHTVEGLVNIHSLSNSFAMFR